VTSQLPGRFRFGDEKRHIVSITDQVTGDTYPEFQAGANDQDAGVIKMMPNPFYPHNRLLVIAGSFGHGTLAGVQLTREKEFLSHPVVATNQFFECLFRVRIIADEPLPAEIIKIEPFPMNNSPSSHSHPTRPLW
jgi:hypothetical protein